MQILAKAAGYDYTAFELFSNLGWYCQPSLVIKLSFELVYGGHINLLLVVFLFCGGVTHCYPLTTAYYPQLPTASTFLMNLASFISVIHSLFANRAPNTTYGVITFQLSNIQQHD